MTNEQTPQDANEGSMGPSLSTAGLEVLCKCGKNRAQEPHACPYAQEINDSTDEEYCTCCDDCRHECCMDI